MDLQAILALAMVVIRVLGPVVQTIVEAVASDRDVTEALAGESTATILPEHGHLDAAMALAHANRAAEQLRVAHADGETDGMSPAQFALVEHAIAIHTLAVVGGP